MSLIIYTKALDNFHEISAPISAQMLEYYNGIGKATIILPINDYNISIVEKNGIIYDTIRDMSFTVQNFKYDTAQNRITVNCFTCNWLLNKRCIVNKRTLANVESATYQLVQENLRGLENIKLSSPKGFDDASDAVLYGGQVLEEIMPVLDVHKIGQRMKWDADNRKHIFELYKGRDLTEGMHAVVFSEKQGTAKNLVISEDDSILKNYMYVLGEKVNDTPVVVEVGTASGDDRYEKWLTGTVRQEQDESESAFLARMREKGFTEISKLISRKTFSVTIDAKEYGKTYKLGDVVSCVSNRFGVELKSRITGVKYSLDTNGEKINLILGEPILTALGEVKINA